jgi:tetratricopeptide (TPR) repeat protein
LEEALALSRELGDRLLIASALTNQGLVAKDQGNYCTAAAVLEEALAVFRDMGFGWGIVESLTALGAIASDQGDFDRAAAAIQEGLAFARDVGDRRGLAMAMEELAFVASSRQEPELAARLVGAAQALREAIGAPVPPADQPRYDRSVTAVHAQLREDAFDEGWESGRLLSLEEAVTEALAVAALRSTGVFSNRSAGAALRSASRTEV